VLPKNAEKSAVELLLLLLNRMLPDITSNTWAKTVFKVIFLNKYTVYNHEKIVVKAGTPAH
jgi:hypothetical protein